MSKRERQLSALELKRKAFFEKEAMELEKQGYVKNDLTVSVIKANIMAIILMLPFIFIFSSLFIYVNHRQFLLEISPVNYFVFLSGFLALTAIHEGIHGLIWGLFAKEHFRSIEFGIIWSMLTPYCTCKEQLKRKQYILGALLPTLIVGIIPAVIAITYANTLLFLLALIMIIGGGGDVLIVLKMLMHRESKSDTIYMDHPYECGVVVFEK